MDDSGRKERGEGDEGAAEDAAPASAPARAVVEAVRSSGAGTAEVRIDLHVHSRFSAAPSSWFLRTVRSAECYTTPREVYDTAKRRGMNLVAITDHDTIDGALELAAEVEDAVVGVEISARFPEDGCVVHTVALDVTEAQHRDLQQLRPNVYELVSYLHRERIAHFLCHPLSSVNRRLTADHVRRCLLMFRTLELMNGMRDRAHEEALRRITDRLAPERLERWAERFPDVPFLNRRGAYAFVGGSDDHARMGIARAFTCFDGERSALGLTEALAAGRVRATGAPAQAHVLAHNAAWVMTSRLRESHDLGSMLAGAVPDAGDAGVSAAASVGSRIASRIPWSDFLERGHTDEVQDRLLEVLTEVHLECDRAAFERLAVGIERVKLGDACDALSGLARLALLGLPYFLGNRYQALDRQMARRISADLGFPAPGRSSPRVAVVADTLDQVDGLSLGLRSLARCARSQDFDVELVGLGGPQGRWSRDEEGVVRIPSLLTRRLDLYPQYAFGIPHLNSLVDYLVRNDVALVQCSTPGPMGIAALIAARLCGLPVVAQFHTDVPAYAAALSGDPALGSLVAGAVGLFYRLTDRVFVPSEAAAGRVRALGVEADKVTLVPRGLDLERFGPGRRAESSFVPFGINGGPKLLYVGRLSREKGLDNLAEALPMVADCVPDAATVLVGDGPLRRELAHRLKPLSDAGRLAFTGMQVGEILPALYASADVFVSPSETETFGNTVVEAQASGLPVVVSNRGAAAEWIRDGVTGWAVDVRRPEELSAALCRLLADEGLRRRMGVAAREHAARFDLARAVRRTVSEYERVLAAADAPR